MGQSHSGVRGRGPNQREEVLRCWRYVRVQRHCILPFHLYVFFYTFLMLILCLFMDFYIWTFSVIHKFSVCDFVWMFSYYICITCIRNFVLLLFANCSVPAYFLYLTSQLSAFILFYFIFYCLYFSSLFLNHSFD